MARQAVLMSESKAVKAAIERWRRGSCSISPADMPSPKFQMYEYAICVFIESGGAVFADVVQIVGMQIGEPGVPFVEWDYMVQQVGVPSEGHLMPGHRDFCLERYLRKLDRASLEVVMADAA